MTIKEAREQMLQMADNEHALAVATYNEIDSQPYDAVRFADMSAKATGHASAATACLRCALLMFEVTA